MFLIGNKEYVDAYSFKHHLPNEAIQLEYACRYLTHAFDVVLNEGGNSTANCTKWKELIAASSENVCIFLLAYRKNQVKIRIFLEI